MGLAICERLTGLMGGRNWVESEWQKGSRFYFTFVAPKGEADIPVNPVESRLNLAELQVLLVEDNAINRMVASRLLEKLDIKVDIAVDGWEAVSMVEKTSYDLVLMDMQMPNMD